MDLMLVVVLDEATHRLATVDSVPWCGREL